MPPIWQYLSLAKYFDLLRTKSLFFPKASLFADETEGKNETGVLAEILLFSMGQDSPVPLGLTALLPLERFISR